MISLIQCIFSDPNIDLDVDMPFKYEASKFAGLEDDTDDSCEFSK